MHYSILLAGLIAAPTAQASTFQTIYSFTGGADGNMPYGKPLLDNKGGLYGVTVIGGPNGGGTVFKLDLASGMLSTLVAFTLFGPGGSEPQAGLIAGKKGVVYGTTFTGGNSANCSQGCGTVFQLNPATGAFTTLATFSGLGDGAHPNGDLLAGRNGMLYGTTELGGDPQGSQGYGTAFQLNPKTKVLTTLHQFSGGSQNDGVHPEAALIADAAGVLYGTTDLGGAHGSGVVFSINPATSAFTLLHQFDYHVDGSSIDCTLLLHGGLLYGTARVGGPTSADDGTVFSLAPDGSSFATLYSFTGNPDGQEPTPGVALGHGGKLYGTTDQGGSAGAGTVYSLALTTHKFGLVHSFNGSDGEGAEGGLAVDKSGALYGVTSGGGSGHGIVFKIVP